MTLKTRSLRTLDDIRAFLDGAVPIGFVAPAGDERRQWVADTFVQFHHFALCRRDKGAVLALVRKVTGFSRAQRKRPPNPPCPSSGGVITRSRVARCAVITRRFDC